MNSQSVSCLIYDIYCINQNHFILKTPRTEKSFSSYEEAKAAFDKIRKPKGKDWQLRSKFADGTVTVIVNSELKETYSSEKTKLQEIKEALITLNTPHKNVHQYIWGYEKCDYKYMVCITSFSKVIEFSRYPSQRLITGVVSNELLHSHKFSERYSQSEIDEVSEAIFDFLKTGDLSYFGGV